jgi:hypothetical protein
MRKIIITQFIVLLVGTLFAWTNWLFELSAWLRDNACQVGCAGAATNPFLTPCFGGAIFFTIAFVLSIVALRSKK